MAPLIEVSNDVLKGLDQLKIPYNLKNDMESKPSIKDNSNFIYVPSINLYVAKERKLHNKNWFESHKELQSNGERMLIIPEFIGFLNYLKSSNNQEYLEIYKDITEVKSPWRAEWLDADFKVKNDRLYINYNHKLTEKGNLVPHNSEVLTEDTLMKDKTPGISLENFLESNHKNQGLPNKKVKSGNLYYWYPKDDNNSVAGFDADGSGAILGCYGVPSGQYSVLGVRAAKQQ
jgi:hypothetical protein